MKLRFGFLGVGAWVLLSILGALSPDARASSEVNLVVEEIQKAVPQAVALEDKDEREGTLTLLALGLARVGRFDAALEVIKHHDSDKLRQANQDEIWRVTARRLAWQRNIEAATRCANRIKGQFSRADAWLAVARATRRTGDSDAVREVLKRAEPAVRATQSPLALAYLAYLYAQNGGTATARQLFALALALPSANILEYNEAYDSQRAIVAHFQVKCAWSTEAVATAGTELDNLQQAKPLLIARREWASLHAFADKLTSRQAIDLLLELAAAQLQVQESDEARKSLAAAKARFASLPLAQQETNATFALRLQLALLEIAQGETEAGWKRFETLSGSPLFNSKWEFAFYYSLIAPQSRSILKLSPSRQEEYEQKAINAWMRQTAADEGVFPFNLVDIARVQIERGAREAAQQTLRLEKSRIRSRIVPDKKGGGTTRTALVAYDLVALAHSEKKAGMPYRVTLTQAENYWRSLKSETGPELDMLADALLRRGFVDEADKILKEILQRPPATIFEFLPARSSEYARAKGVAAAVQWIHKFPGVTLQSMALYSLAYSLGGVSPHERNELSLRGDSLENLKVDGWPRSNYRPVFDLTAFTIHE